MIEVVARVADELGTLRESNLDRPDILRDERLGTAVTRRIPQGIRQFDALRDEPALQGEAEVRIGYLELRRRRWADALVRFERARGLTTEPFLLAVTGYLAGWTLEQLERPDEAIAAYERAHAISPDMRDLSTRYAALLFTSGRRTDAHDVLAAMHATDAPFELLTMFERGDARLVSEYLARLREALR
jgi:tetratricopeptide (TPR) repeat protein